jgi:dTDP-4-amino-4,6-dideoxygalactose transaminase
MNISALDLKKQIAPIRRDIDEAIARVINNTSFILGPEVVDFEEKAAQYCGSKFAIGVSNGTDSISLSLLALGIGENDGVICPAFTYYASAGAIANIGARPVFVDIDKDTYNISIDNLNRALSRKRKGKIKAIIPVHLYGQCADMDAVMKVARKYDLKVVEDTAQAFGAEFRGKKAGTIGDCGSVSFYPGKNLGAFGDAGLVITNKRNVYERIKVLRNQGNKVNYYHEVIGRNNRIDALQAAILNVKLKYLDSWNEGRRDVARYYNEKLSVLRLKTPFLPDYTNHIYHQYVLRLEYSSKKIIDYLRSKGIDSRVFYPVPLHLQKCFKYLGYKKGDFPESEKAAVQTFTLPIYPELTKEEKDYIIQSVKEFMNA